MKDIINNLKFKLLFLILVFSNFMCSAQLFYNNGAQIFTNNNSIVYVDGIASNNSSGTLQNSGSITITDDFINNASASGGGTYRIAGDWINNDSFSSGAGNVILEGDSQLISGSVATVFNILELSGSGVKTQTINAYVSNILDISDRELATEYDTMFIISSDINAITYTTGFISSLGDGCLSRLTNANSIYEFPVGSSLNTPRFRPVEITPTSADSNNFAVRFANNEAGIDGYDRNYIDSTFCGTNPDFYHRINKISGSDSALISIYFDQAIDGLWDGLAHWTTNPDSLWQNMGLVTENPGIPLGSLSKADWADFSDDPYILIRDSISLNLGEDTTICEGQDLTLYAGLGFDSYLWSTGVNGIDSIIINTSGPYNVTITLGICSLTDQIKISSKPTPTANAGENTSICEGDSVNLIATGGISYEWSTTDTSQTVMVYPDTVTTYFVTVTEDECWDMDSVTIDVNPIPTTNISGDDTICEGDPSIITITGGSQYIWNTGDTTQSVSYTPATSTTYFVTTTENNCFRADSFYVMVNPALYGFAGSDQEICTGDSIQLTASGGVTYNWSTGDSISSIYVDPIASTDYYVTISDGTCPWQDTVAITVNSIPTADAGTNDEICSGDSIILTATGGSVFSWSTTDNSQTITVSPASTITYYVTVSENACEASDSVIITVWDSPVANVGNNENICYGDNTTLSVNGGFSQIWNTGDTTQTIIVSPLISTTYYVTVSENNCFDTDSVEVTVNVIPLANAGADQSICESDSLSLIASGGSTYFWNTSDTTQTITVSPITTTEYIVVVSNNGCVDSDSVIITVNPTPTDFVSPNQTICSNDTIQLTASEGDNYVWSTTESTASIYVTPDLTTTYFVTATLGSCSGTDSVVVTVELSPQANAGTDQSICSGDVVNLSATGGDSYLWSTAQTSATINVAPSETTDYQVTVTVGNCSDTDQVNVSVNTLPLADAGEDLIICQGDTLQLYASGGIIYEWQQSQYISDQYVPDPYVYPYSTSMFIVNISDGTCSVDDTLFITVNSTPSVFAGNDSVVATGASVQLNALGNTSGLTYDWYPLAGLSNPYIANPIVTVDDTITYTVVVTNINDCQSSDNITLYPTGTHVVVGDSLEIFNTFTPNGDEVNDTWVINNLDKYTKRSIVIYNRNGQKVFEQNNYQNDWDGKYYGNDLPAATYYYILVLDEDEIIKGDVTIIR